MKAVLASCLVLFNWVCSCGPGKDACSSEKKDSSSILKQKPDSLPPIRYSESALLDFIDSVEKIPLQSLILPINQKADSVFRSQVNLNKSLTESDFLKLQQAIKSQEIRVDLARSIFGPIEIDSFNLAQGKIPLTFFSFGPYKYAFQDFALCLGYPDAGWTCQLYFFQGPKLLALHTIEHHYGLAIKRFKDKDGKTVVYYRQNFGTGTGIWQFNYNFYKYDENGLLPVLNILQNGNLQSPWGMRIYWLEAYVKKTNPLTLGFEYNHALYDSSGIGHRILEGKTMVPFHWDEISKQLIGDFSKSKLSMAQTYAYYLDDNELIFIHTHATLLRECMKKPKQKVWALEFLNRTKNNCKNVGLRKF